MVCKFRVEAMSSSSNPLAGLNPADIDDIQILQGPSATAIYGSRATNGVMLITTKRGKSGEAKINYGFQYNIQAPPKHLEVMNLPQYAQMVDRLSSNSRWNRSRRIIGSFHS